MIKGIILDAGPLGKIAHPRPNPDFIDWFKRLLMAGYRVILPEIADYEVRRSLLHKELNESIKRLNRLKEEFDYLPLDTETMLLAAEFWAHARKIGKPTADPHELDCDVILAAQARRSGATVVTENIGHLSLFVKAKNWNEIAV
ncbi:MAG: PIN domain-containing protein [bacterium]